MAIGFIGQFLVKLAEGIADLNIWQFIAIVIGIMLIISLPSMFIAWRKLRKRDLGPVLNANGWAINAASYVKPRFGKSLTSLVKYPKLKAVDPVAAKKARRRAFFTWLIVILLLAGGGYWGYTKYQACKAAKAAAEAEAAEAAEAAAAEAAVVEEVAAPAEAEAATPEGETASN